MTVGGPVELEDALARVASREEFGAYGELDADIRAKVVAEDLPAIRREMEAKVVDLQRAERIIDGEIRTRVILSVIALILLIGFGLLFAIMLLGAISLAVTERSLETFGIVTVLVLSAPVVGALAWWRGLRRSIARRRRDRQSLVDIELRSWVEAAVSRAYTRAAGSLVEAGAAPFPSSAPRLIEIDVDNVVPSSSIDRVFRFITDHDTSAIGITGPRGVGKSTLLRAVCERTRDASGKAVLIPAPVEHDTVDLLRSLVYELHASIRGPRSSRLDRAGGARRRSVRRGLIAVAAGSLAIAAIMLIVLTILPSIDVLETIATQWPVALGVGLLIAAAALLLLGPVPDRVARSLGRAGAGTGGAILDQLVEELRFELSESDSVGARVGGPADLSAERSRSRTTRDLSRARIVDGLRDALRALGAESGDGPFLIAIDELDKLPTRDALLGTVNGMKDLLHIPNVHVAVTLSDEALRAFDLRETGERDAFDSTFDTIVEVQRLDAAGAAAILEARVVGFPRELAGVCYVWSAGLPRDLLRHARSCIEYTRGRDPVPRWDVIALAVTHAEMAQKITGTIFSGASAEEVEAASELNDRWAARAPRADELANLEAIGELTRRLCAYGAMRYAAIWTVAEHGIANRAIPAELDRLRDGAVAASTAAGVTVAEHALRDLEAVPRG
ncbi:hypothetical protein [Agromyces binzhouensis]|uniref:hypothetical protein n=1 Tax=Agromyces binzhouensis TaxID=1817495 RepID=UPI0036277A55